MRKHHTFCLLLGLMGAGQALSGCTSMIVGAGAATGVAVVQERSVGDAIDDKTIQAQVNIKLLDESAVLFRKVDVKVIEGKVILTGGVKKPDQRVAATRIAWKVKGVQQVENELQVTDQGGIINYGKDTWITTQLRSKMLTDSSVLDINYSVETVNGIVYLIGIAQNEGELIRVTDYARNIGGVLKVVSHVRMKDGPDQTT